MGQHIENKKDKLYEQLRSTQERYNAEYDKYLDEKRNFEEVMTETDDLYHSARQQIQDMEDYTVACLRRSTEGAQLIHEFYDKVFQVQDNLEIEYRREREGVEEECLLLDKRFRKKSDKYDEELAHIRRDIYGEK